MVSFACARNTPKETELRSSGDYIDRAQSAKTDHRPEFQHMIKDSYKNMFNTVLVWELDRFARNRMTARITKISSKRTACALSQSKRVSRRAQTVSCLRRSWKAMLNTIQPNFRKRSSAE